MPYSNNAVRFMGLTKGQFFGVILMFVVLMCCIDAYLVERNSKLSAEGAQSHSVLCVLKRDYTQRRTDAQKFVAMTPAQRTRKFGAAFGSVPNAVVQQSIRGLDANIKAMRGLECDT